MKNIEHQTVVKFLKAEIKKLGGEYLPWKGVCGEPDGIIAIDGGLWLVESKTDNGTLSPKQIRYHKKLAKCGIKVHIVYGLPQAHTFITNLRKLNVN